MPEFEALIFDCDGTLVDSMPAHYRAWVTTLSRYQLHLSEDEFYARGGWPTLVVAERVAKDSGRDLDIERIAHEKEAEFERTLHQIQSIEPVARVAREFHGKLPLGVATGGFRHICEPMLRHVGLLELFACIVTCDDVVRHKPAPDIYLETARRLGVRPERCLAYEDTNPGLEAAHAAGMRTIDVRTLYQPKRVTSC